MPTLVSQLELQGSPFEQASWWPQTWYWDPASGMEAGESISSVSLAVLQYDPAFPEETLDVTSTVLDMGSPFTGTGLHGNQLGFTVVASVLQPGYSYRCQMGVTGDQGSTPAAFLVIRCKV